MGKFDEFVNKAKETADVAFKKTGELVNTGKNKLNIATVKNEMEKDFADLGRIFYRQLKDNAENSEDVKRIIQDIKAKETEIEKLELEIADSKNKIICPNCRALNAENSVVCNNCGAKIK